MDWLKPLSSRGVSSAGDNNDTQVGWLRVMQGNAQPQHIALARQVFAQHLNEVSWSLAGYHTLDYRMTDGSVLRIVSNSGIHQAMLWVPGDETPKYYRGFVIWPKLEDGAESSWGDTNALIACRATPKWSVVVAPFEPGRAYSALTYFVDSIRSTAPAGMQEEGKFFDVYLWADSVLYVNGIRSGGLIGNTGMLFVVLRHGDPVERTAFTATSGAVYRVSSSLPDRQELFAYAPYFAPSTEVFTMPPRLAPEANRIDLEFLGKTIAGALQVRRAEVELITADPWAGATTIEDQLNVPGLVFSDAAYGVEVFSAPSEPLFPVIDSSVMVCGWVYPGDSFGTIVSFSGYITATSLVTDDSTSVLPYSETITISDAVSLYAGVQFTMSRICDISGSLEHGDVFWRPGWPGPTCWTAASIPSYGEVGSYELFLMPPTDLSSPPYIVNDPVTEACSERRDSLIHSDTTISKATADEPIGTIYEANTTHLVTHKESLVIEYVADSPPETRSGATKIYYDESFVLRNTGWDIDVNPTKHATSAVTRTDRTEELSVIGEAKDYLYCDAQNGVNLYLHSEITGRTLTINGSAVIKEFALHCRLKLSSPLGEYASEEQTFTSDEGVQMDMLFPTGISFGTSSATWMHVSPKQAMPLFTPSWFDQGSCPHIAYTTQSEAVQRLLASFRIQVLLGGRPALAEVPTVVGATTVKAPMMEQLVDNHLLGWSYTMLAPMESQPFILNASYPGTTVHTDLGITGAEPKSEFYRT